MLVEFLWLWGHKTMLVYYENTSGETMLVYYEDLLSRVRFDIAENWKLKNTVVK